MRSYFYQTLCLFIVLFFTQTLYARNGIYISPTAGLSRQSKLPTAAQMDAQNLSRGSDFNALRVGLGYNHDLAHLPWIGLGFEAGWGRYGNHTYIYPHAESHIDNTTLEFLGVANLHKNRWHALIKWGGLRQTIRITGKDSADTNTVISQACGFGVGYSPRKHWMLIANYLHFFGKTVNNLEQYTHNGQNPTVNAFLMGFRFIF